MNTHVSFTCPVDVKPPNNTTLVPLPAIANAPRGPGPQAPLLQTWVQTLPVHVQVSPSSGPPPTLFRKPPYSTTPLGPVPRPAPARSPGGQGAVAGFAVPHLATQPCPRSYTQVSPSPALAPDADPDRRTAQCASCQWARQRRPRRFGRRVPTSHAAPIQKTRTASEPPSRGRDAHGQANRDHDRAAGSRPLPRPAAHRTSRDWYPSPSRTAPWRAGRPLTSLCIGERGARLRQPARSAAHRRQGEGTDPAPSGHASLVSRRRDRPTPCSPSQRARRCATNLPG